MTITAMFFSGSVAVANYAVVAITSEHSLGARHEMILDRRD